MQNKNTQDTSMWCIKKEISYSALLEANISKLMPLFQCPTFESKNCTCMAVKSQPSLLKSDSSLYSSIAKRQHSDSNKSTAVSPTYRAQRERKPEGASREPWISPAFIYVSDQTYCALNSHSSQNKFSDVRHPSVDVIVFLGLWLLVSSWLPKAWHCIAVFFHVQTSWDNYVCGIGVVKSEL